MIAKLESFHVLHAEDARESILTARRKVCEMIEQRGPLSDRRLAQILGWDINTVVPRRNELVKEGKVREVGTTWDGETKRTVTLWEITTEKYR